MHGNSRRVTSSQTEVSHQLQQLVEKHLQQAFEKPLHRFSKSQFNTVNRLVNQSGLPIILDAGCGTGDSTIAFSERYPDKLVIGIDKSISRLGKHVKIDSVYRHDNLILIHGDLVDYWRLIAQAEWPVEKHYILYPNPWPKPGQIKRCWYGHPVFPKMLSICRHIELRSNWKIYVNEFRLAYEQATGFKATMKRLKPGEYLSPFEKKYANSGHELYSVTS